MRGLRVYTNSGGSWLEVAGMICHFFFSFFFFFYAKEDCMEIIVVDKVKYYEQIQIN